MGILKKAEEATVVDVYDINSSTRLDHNDKVCLTHISKIINFNDDVVVDVGANLGEYTEYFSSCLKGSGTIYSIELHPNTYQSLLSRFSTKPNIKIFNNAVSDTNGEITYYLGIDSFQHNIIGHDMGYKDRPVGGTVEAITLDSLLANEDKVRLIKIDVEGAELSVLKGMSSTINKTDYILVENHLDEDWEEIRSLLLDTYNLSCMNLMTMEEMTEDTPRVYQCLCKSKSI
jgi:FkbM family methyltransferase|tara:strand:+ start:2256 stop:2948 length:693 start_codon:yes stop_codon:yes gene_type:complete